MSRMQQAKIKQLSKALKALDALYRLSGNSQAVDNIRRELKAIEL